MNECLSKDKLVSTQAKLNAALSFNKEYIWKNILKIEALKKENALNKSQDLCKNLKIKL